MENLEELAPAFRYLLGVGCTVSDLRRIFLLPREKILRVLGMDEP